MCTKVNIEGKAVTSGCYTDKSNGREVEVCLCESGAGRYPCNYANSNSLQTTIVLFTMTFIGVFYFFFIN